VENKCKTEGCNNLGRMSPNGKVQLGFCQECHERWAKSVAVSCGRLAEFFRDVKKDGFDSALRKRGIDK
jgi:hypothetical protein